MNRSHPIGDSVTNKAFEPDDRRLLAATALAGPPLWDAQVGVAKGASHTQGRMDTPLFVCGAVRMMPICGRPGTTGARAAGGSGARCWSSRCSA